MSLVEIEAIDRFEVDRSLLRRAEIDVQPGKSFDTYALALSGWVLGQSSPAVAVEVETRGAPVMKAPVSAERLDVAELYPAVPEAGRSGFLVTASVLGRPQVFDLQLRALLLDGTRVPLGSLRVRRRPLETGFDAQLQPLMLTSLGRTGTHWILLVLSQHPAVVAYRPLQLEPRIASYWMLVLDALSKPGSYLQGLAGSHVVDPCWWLSVEDRGLVPEDGSEVEQWIAERALREFHDWWATGPDPAAARSLGRDNVEGLAAFCQQRIAGFYEGVAAALGRGDARYFVEKHLPHDFVPAMLWELYPDARELILVRDPRDVVCSVAAFGAKLGYAGSDANGIVLDEESILRMRAGFVDLLEASKQRPKAHVVRYEDLIRRPLETLEGVLEYLDVDTRDAGPRELLDRSSGTSLEQQRLHSTSSDPLASVERWRRELHPSLQAVCLDAFGEVLDEFGYVEDDRAPLTESRS